MDTVDTVKMVDHRNRLQHSKRHQWLASGMILCAVELEETVGINQEHHKLMTWRKRGIRDKWSTIYIQSMRADRNSQTVLTAAVRDYL